MSKLVPGILAAGVLASCLVATPAAAAPPEFVPAPIQWGPCESDGLARARAECGFLAVPLDYQDPAGAKISLAVSRVRHTNSDYQGVMLVNPGGPGGSGLELSALGRAVPKGAGNSYDWVGFDPRGVGSSRPALSCDPGHFGYNRPAYVPATPQLEQSWLGTSRDYATACAKNGPLLEHMRTTDVARDLDSLRQALGAEQINYYGFSYGTYLGQVYATRYPERVRRMVLDSNVDPRKVFYQANLDQDVAFDRNIKVYFDWLARHDDAYHLGTTAEAVEDLWYAQQRELSEEPAGGVIGPDEWTDIFLQAGYYQSTWEDLAKAFAGWVHQRDWQTLKTRYDRTSSPGDDNGFAVYNAVQCTDAPWPRSWTTWKVDNWITYAKARFETWGNAWYNAPCRTWPVPAGKAVDVDGRRVAGALLIGEEFDAATPFTGNLEVRRRFPRSSLIGEPGGTTHAGSLSGDACVDDRIADYLATGALPPRQKGDGPDALCDPLPEPVPGGAAGARADRARAGQPAVLRDVLRAVVR
ncbi:alpha/beta hydrolase [Amycolatopsis viridis]|uniref:Pimeloyl-ACP methyl ester carboxylesterase n=1 Tax=Amycolatopsis viridis TaxID=185678 RepID=A0ABX0SVT6_9PSEU|nr:alpha/beta hydrolase [Amycolatopsis viridis]NIH81086.1 pimeloyl-ACP methyl ester carboxylesterase [Amycolatopsis viridis]